ncbi:MAG: endonuclease III domain-containing protein [Thermodesulfobacteriota bacterium]|nr:endonuclease III domain-containing protein [Thermodesulfobacteriota bacterium]
MISSTSTGRKMMAMFHLLLDHFGHQGWWPGETRLEILIGAMLTQNTNWANVEKAIKNLKESEEISLERLYSLKQEELAQAIRPAGYFNVKARRLRNLIHFIMERYHGNLSECLAEEPDLLRKGLLSVNGIGPETADTILLYAAGHPIFVVDAYTHRILSRHNMIEEDASYEALQSLFMEHLPDDPVLFNEFHALIVRTGKETCHKKPLCDSCPLLEWGTLSRH